MNCLVIIFTFFNSVPIFKSLPRIYFIVSYGESLIIFIIFSNFFLKDATCHLNNNLIPIYTWAVS